MRPRVLFAGHTTYDIPLSPSLSRKWEALEEVLEPRVIGAAGRASSADDPRFRLLRIPDRLPFGGGAHHVFLPFVIAAETQRFRPHAIICESPYEAFTALPATVGARSPKLIVEVHGDWRTASRLYGSRGRRLVSPFADRAAMLALRRADATRALSAYTASLIEKATGRPPLATFPTYTDSASFLDSPVEAFPERPTALWVGVLERYKNADGLEGIWRRVAARVPEARLVVIGRGPLRPVIERLVSEYPGRVDLFPRLSPDEVARSLDGSTALLLPSRSEGLGRVVIEAFARGRPVVAAAAGGIPDLVEHERNGLLAPPGDNDAFAEATIRVLRDPALARRLGGAAEADAVRLCQLATDYARSVRELIDKTLAGAGPR